jgi:hypothetical protein
LKPERGKFSLSGFGQRIIVIHEFGFLGITIVDFGFIVIPGGAMTPAATSGWPFLVPADLQGKQHQGHSSDKK